MSEPLPLPLTIPGFASLVAELARQNRLMRAALRASGLSDAIVGAIIAPGHDVDTDRCTAAAPDDMFTDPEPTSHRCVLSVGHTGPHLDAIYGTTAWIHPPTTKH